METTYVPINCSFHDVLLAKATNKVHCKVQYFTDIREFITTHALIKDIFTKDKEEFMVLASGEIIRLDRIVTVDGIYAPQYAHIQDFTCDC